MGYLDGIKYTREEQLEFIRSYKKNPNAEDLENIIQSCVAIIRGLIKKHFSWAGEHKDDLFQEGCISIGKALTPWDEQRGVPFNSYAYVTCKHDLFIYARKNTHKLRVSENHVNDLIKVKKALDNKPRATTKELIELTELDEVKVKICVDSINREYVSNDSGFMNLIPCEDNMPEVERRDLAKAIRVELDSLEPEERELIESEFGIGREKMTRSELAKKAGRSRERIRQRKEIVLKKLKKRLVHLKPDLFT